MSKGEGTWGVGFVHVLTEPGGPCRTTCPHPEHACHHCGRSPEADGDHTCSCPRSHSECLEHTLHPHPRSQA